MHLAARVSVPGSVLDPEDTHEVNATGTVRVLDAARRAGGLYVVLASSAAVYGPTTALPIREHLPPATLSPYAASKLAGEGSGLAYAHCYGLPVLTFRFFNVFGPGQPADHAYAAVIPAFVTAALAGRPLTIHGDGLQTRDMVFVDTVTAVISEALARRLVHPGPVNLSLGTRRTLLAIVAGLEAVLGTPLAVEHTDPRPGDIRHSQADSTRLRALMPSLPEDDFDAALRATVAWFRSSAAPP